jgi:hypothetical protein
MPQEHINHFTQGTLSRVLEAAGLRPVACSVAHSDGSISTPAMIGRGTMRAPFRLSGGRLNWQHPLSCIVQKGRQVGWDRGEGTLERLPRGPLTAWLLHILRRNLRSTRNNGWATLSNSIGEGMAFPHKM